MHNSHFILFCIFSLSSVFDIEPLARKIVQTLPTSSILNKLFYSILFYSILLFSILNSLACYTGYFFLKPAIFKITRDR